MKQVVLYVPWSLSGTWLQKIFFECKGGSSTIAAQVNIEIKSNKFKYGKSKSDIAVEIIGWEGMT